MYKNVYTKGVNKKRTTALPMGSKTQVPAEITELINRLSFPETSEIFVDVGIILTTSGMYCEDYTHIFCADDSSDYIVRDNQGYLWLLVSQEGAISTQHPRVNWQPTSLDCKIPRVYVPGRTTEQQFIELRLEMPNTELIVSAPNRGVLVGTKFEREFKDRINQIFDEVF